MDWETLQYVKALAKKYLKKKSIPSPADLVVGKRVVFFLEGGQRVSGTIERLLGDGIKLKNDPDSYWFEDMTKLEQR